MFFFEVSTPQKPQGADARTDEVDLVGHVSKKTFEAKNPRRWTKGLPGNSISVLAYCTQARSFTIHESSHDEKVGISQHEKIRGVGRFVFRQGCFLAVRFLAYKNDHRVF